MSDFDRKTRIHLHLMTLRVKRQMLDEYVKQLEALKAGAPLPSPMGGVGMHVRGGSVNDSTYSEAMRRINRRRFLEREIPELHGVLLDFKRALQDAGLNDVACAAMWARWVFRKSTQETMALTGIDDPRVVGGVLRDAEHELVRCGWDV